MSLAFEAVFLNCTQRVKSAYHVKENDEAASSAQLTSYHNFPLSSELACPSALEESNLTGPSKPIPSTTAIAASLMETSASSGTAGRYHTRRLDLLRKQKQQMLIGRKAEWLDPRHAGAEGGGLTENDRLDRVIVAHDPYHELTQVLRVDKLAQRSA